MQKRWRILNSDGEKTNALFKELKIHPALCGILVQRGIDNYNKAKQFFRPQLSDLHDPFLMKDMNKAVDRIVSAFSNNEKILEYGDYDVGSSHPGARDASARPVSNDGSDVFHVPPRVGIDTRGSHGQGGEGD